MTRQFRNALDDFIEQQERMRRLLEPDYLRFVRQAQELAQPMMQAARIAEEATRPLADAVRISEDIGRQLVGATALDNTSLALSKALGSEMDATRRALASSGILDYVKDLDGLTAGWRSAFTEVDAITKAMGSTLVGVGKQAADSVAKLGQPGLGNTIGTTWQGIEAGLRAADPKLADHMMRPFTDSIGETLRQIETLNLPQLEASVFDALHATANAFPDIGSLAAGLKFPDIDFTINDELARAFERFVASAREAARRREAADLETLVADADAVLVAATTDDQRKALSWFLRVAMLPIVLGIVSNLGTEGIKALYRGLLPYLVVLLTGVHAPAVLPPAGLTPPGLMVPASPAESSSPLAPRNWQVEGLPEIIRRAGPAAQRQTLEFFAAKTRNPNTRQAYVTAVMRFMHWCEDRNLELIDITAITVTAYVEEMQREYAPPTVKQHLAAIRTLFDYLVMGHVLAMNPASDVRRQKPIVNNRRTPVLQPVEARWLLESIDVTDLTGLRDRALLAVMMYGCARVSAVVSMDVRDYYQRSGQWWLQLHEKGGRRHELPVHRQAKKYLNAYIAAAGLKNRADSPLWRTMTKDHVFSERRMSRVDVFRMVKRRARGAKLGDDANCHTLRATGISTYLLNGGTLERAQAIAAHESPEATRVYAPLRITISDIDKIDI
jgi:integrase/recombinase XerD